MDEDQASLTSVIQFRFVFFVFIAKLRVVFKSDFHSCTSREGDWRV